MTTGSPADVRPSPVPRARVCQGRSARALPLTRPGPLRSVLPLDERSGGPDHLWWRRWFAGDRRGSLLVAVNRGDQVLAQTQCRVDLLLDLLRQRRVGVEVGVGVAAPLAEAVVAVGEERAGLGDDV